MSILLAFESNGMRRKKELQFEKLKTKNAFDSDVHHPSLSFALCNTGPRILSNHFLRVLCANCTQNEVRTNSTVLLLRSNRVEICLHFVFSKFEI